MIDIKTRKVIKNIKVLDKSAELSKNMKDAFVRTKDKAEETQQTTHDTPNAYATDKASEKANEVTNITAYKAERFGRNSTKKVYNNIKAFRNNHKVVQNWADVLSVYSVKTSTGDNHTDVVEWIQIE